MARRVFVTGIGIFSAIGRNAAEVLDSLQNGRSGVGPLTILETVHRADLPAAEIPLTNRQLGDIAGIPDIHFLTRTSLLGILAAREAFQHAGLKPSDHGFRTGVVSASTVGGMDKTENFFRNFDQAPGYNDFIFTHDCGDSTERIADTLGIRDYVTTISTACSSSANAIMHGAKLIKHGVLDRVIAGGTDALSRFTLNGFNTLMILDKNPCRPFDATRTGLNLGEGAAYIILESEEALQGRPALCELTGYANANDAYHQTASSPEATGPFLSMSGALQASGLAPADIDYINAHGTGTDNNDLTEGIAIERIFGKDIPPVSSTKPFTGHTLGAAAAVEAVLSILSIRNGLIYPNMNFSTKIEELNFEPVKKLITGVEVRNVLSNSFGFGGNDSTLIFSAI
jgi:3-oxoacyl-[acyl-carrier-protein] synthase-1